MFAPAGAWIRVDAQCVCQSDGSFSHRQIRCALVGDNRAGQLAIAEINDHRKIAQFRVLESLGGKHYIGDARCIDKATRIVLVSNARVKQGSHRDVITRRGIVLSLENRVAASLSCVRRQGPPVTWTARVLD